jgi:Lsr2
MVAETVYRDDINQEVGAERRRFSLDGKEYEIDLTDDNFKRLQDALAEFIAAARPVTSSSKAKRSSSARKPASGKSRSKDDGRAKAIRAWARDNGYKVSTKGRIAPDVIAAYEAANP